MRSLSEWLISLGSNSRITGRRWLARGTYAPEMRRASVFADIHPCEASRADSVVHTATAASGSGRGEAGSTGPGLRR